MATPEIESTTYRCKYGEMAKLNSHNYRKWRQAIEGFLIEADALRIVLGEEAPPGGPPQVAAAKDYHLRSGTAVAMIHASCFDAVKTHISGVRDPERMWEILKEKHDTAHSRNGQQSVFSEFASLRPLGTDSSINDYVMRLKRCQNELRETELAINDLMFTNQLLNHLPSAFNVVERPIVDKPQDIQTADYVIDRILEEERVIKSENESAPASDLTFTKALAATSSARPPHNHRASTPRLKCWSCGKLGHKRADCRKQRDGRSHGRAVKQERPQAAASSASASASATASSASASAAGVSEERETYFDYEVQCLIARAQTSYPPKPPTCIIDFSATHHLCNDRSQFSTFGRLKLEINMVLRDGSIVPAPASGMLTLRLSTGTSIRLEALYAPKLRQSLISVSKLALHHQITFRGKNCHLNGDLLGIHKDGVYELAGATKLIARASVASVSKAITTDRWHQRLGHLGNTAVKELLKMHATLPSAETAETDAEPLALPDVDPGPGKTAEDPQTDLCQICVKAKHQRKIERQPVAHVTRSLELIHSDLAGPISAPSSSGKRYFILYIDNFSRVASVFFLRGKTQKRSPRRFRSSRLAWKNVSPTTPSRGFVAITEGGSTTTASSGASWGSLASD